MQKTTWKKLREENLEGNIFLLPTDTIYGFSALAFDYEAQEKVIELKQRDTSKYFINLISDLKQMKLFGVEITERQKKFLQKNWPGRVTIIFRDKNNEKISFRIPAHRQLRKFIQKVGPIISTSANIYNRPHIKEPKNLSEKMQNNINFYIDEGELKNAPSIILEVLR